MFDAHCHLDDPTLAPFAQRLIQQASHLKGMINCSVKPETWGLSLPDAPFPIIRAIGFHPWYSCETTPEQWTLLRQTLTANPQYWIGEIGLDATQQAPDDIDCMIDCYQAQLDLAAELKRPIVLHGAHMWQKLFNLANDYADKIPAIVVHGVGFHPQILAHPLLQRDTIFLSINGAVSWHNRHRTQDLAIMVSDDKLLIETDSPGFFPQGGDPLTLGRPELLNQSSNLLSIAKTIATLRNTDWQTIEALTDRNAQRLLDLAK